MHGLKRRNMCTDLKRKNGKVTKVEISGETLPVDYFVLRGEYGVYTYKSYKGSDFR